MNGSHLVIDDGPAVRNNLVVVVGEGMIAHPWGAKRVVGDVHFDGQALCGFDNVICCQLGHGPAQRMPSHQHLHVSNDGCTRQYLHDEMLRLPCQSCADAWWSI